MSSQSERIPSRTGFPQMNDITSACTAFPLRTSHTPLFFRSQGDDIGIHIPLTRTLYIDPNQSICSVGSGVSELEFRTLSALGRTPRSSFLFLYSFSPFPTNLFILFRLPLSALYLITISELLLNLVIREPRLSQANPIRLITTVPPHLSVLLLESLVPLLLYCSFLFIRFD